MDKQWEKSVLISYLYGEIEPNEKIELEKELAENPSLQQELKELRDTREIMGKLGDKEVIEPQYLFNGIEVSNGRSPFRIRTWMAVAASILLLFLAAYFTGASVKISKGEIALTWSDSAREELLTREQMDQIIDQKVRELQARTEDGINEKLDIFKGDIETKLTEYKKESKKEIIRLVGEEAGRREETLNLMVASLREQNLQTLASFIELNSKQQKDEIQRMLVDFNDYLNQQRQSDLIAIDQNLKTLKENSELKFQETGVILASIINTVKTQNN